MKNTREYTRNVSVTTTYIFSELMENPLFFSYIDEAMDIAIKFIDTYKTGTDWEKHSNEAGKTWEEELYEFYNDYLNNKLIDRMHKASN